MIRVLDRKMSEEQCPGVLTEEVVDDNGMFDQQISIDLTPCSENHQLIEEDIAENSAA